MWATVGAWIQMYCPELDPTDCTAIFSEQPQTAAAVYTKQISEFPPVTHNIAPIISSDMTNACNDI